MLGSFVLSVACDEAAFGGTGLAESVMLALGYAEECITNDPTVHMLGLSDEERSRLVELRLRRLRLEAVLCQDCLQDAYRRRRSNIMRWLQWLESPLPAPEVIMCDEDILF